MGKRGFEHTDVQREGRIRDLGMCQICGSKDVPQGHHVFDFQFGGSADLDNIVTLCRKCHKKVHKGDMDIFVF